VKFGNYPRSCDLRTGCSASNNIKATVPEEEGDGKAAEQWSKSEDLPVCVGVSCFRRKSRVLVQDSSAGYLSLFRYTSLFFP